ncbi:hypothetical protein ABH926_000646 [Catenulispora sp. GP43]|uniref:hypothetical protein n=1 Tax=Catenulispora sp. GP43 TaxID=3156263 RepID=UPI0035189C24
MVLLKQGKMYRGLIGALGGCLLLAGCSSSQKPAALAPVGGNATGTSAGTSGSATSTEATTGSSGPTGSTTGSSPGAPAPTSVATSNGGWAYNASVPGDTAIADAMTAFENYAALSYQMAITMSHNNNLVNYADGNVESLLNNFVTEERQKNIISRGQEGIRVMNVSKDTGDPPIVSITVCTDDSKLPMYSTYGPNKGKIVVPAQPATVSVYKVHQSFGGKWRVYSVSPSSTAC